MQTRVGSIFTWTLAIPGGKGTSWEGLVYDLEINFSRRHPFEPPRVEFPRTHRNVSNPGHPLVDGSGRLRMQKLSFDKWLPTIEVGGVYLMPWCTFGLTLCVAAAVQMWSRRREFLLIRWRRMLSVSSLLNHSLTHAQHGSASRGSALYSCTYFFCFYIKSSVYRNTVSGVSGQ